MSTIFPLRETVSLDDEREPRLVDLDDDVADEVFQALSSGTTREIFGALHDQPQTASDLAEVTDTSVQNVQYHLEKLVDTDLVEVVETWYSERGTEMKVYAPTDESLVLFAGRDKRRSLRTLLTSVLGVLATLLPAAAIVAWVARQLERQAPATTDGSGDYKGSDGGSAGGADGGSVQSTDSPGISTQTGGDAGGATPTPSGGAVDGAVDAVASTGLDPALLAGGAFLLGGLFVVVVLSGYYWRQG